MKIYFAASCAYEVRMLSSGGVKNVLISYWLWKNCTQRSLDSLKKMNVMVDSGAYSAYNSGTEINLNKYCNFINKIRKQLNIACYVSLDVIGDHKATSNNLKKMESTSYNPMPVFHRGSSFKILEGLVKDYEVVGIGGMVGNRNKQFWRWLNELFTRFPNHNFHGFGMTSERGLRYPWHSVDSSSWYTNYSDRKEGETNKESIKRRISKYLALEDKYRNVNQFQEVII